MVPLQGPAPHDSTGHGPNRLAPRRNVAPCQKAEVEECSGAQRLAWRLEMPPVHIAGSLASSADTRQSSDIPAEPEAGVARAEQPKPAWSVDDVRAATAVELSIASRRPEATGAAPSVPSGPCQLSARPSSQAPAAEGMQSLADHQGAENASPSKAEGIRGGLRASLEDISNSLPRLELTAAQPPSPSSPSGLCIIDSQDLVLIELITGLVPGLSLVQHEAVFMKRGKPTVAVC